RGGDDLVGLSRHQAFEYLVLALRKTVKPRGDRSEFAVRDTLGPFERGFDRIENGLLIERLLDEVDGARLHRFHGQRHVAVAGDDDRRQAWRVLLKAVQKLDAGHVGHTHVGDETAAL